MATTAAAIDNVIKLSANPVTVALAFTEGVTLQRPGMDGRPRVMFTTTDQPPRRIFCSDEEANEIEHELGNLGVQKGDPIVLTRIGRGDSAIIRVERAAPPASRIPAASAPTSHSQTLVVGSVLPAAPAVQPAATEPAQGNTQARARFSAAYVDAIEVLIAAKAYAQSRGLALEIRCEDARALAATMMIDAQKGGR